MAQEKFGGMDVGLIDIDELKELSGDEIKEMWDQVARLQWDYPTKNEIKLEIIPTKKWNNKKQRRIKR